MIFISALKPGSMIKALVDIKEFDVKVGDKLAVIKTGLSAFDKKPFAEVLTSKGCFMEIMNCTHNFDLVRL